jgi:hypothetical protein
MGREQLAGELASLPSLDASALKERFAKLWGHEPPAFMGQGLMRLAIAHRLQEQVMGCLKPRIRRCLEEVLIRSADPKRAPALRIKPGTRLLREWQGVTHEVTVADDGVLFRGERHRSLSEVARLITGARWSGPLFFGLKEPRRAA